MVDVQVGLAVGLAGFEAAESFFVLADSVGDVSRDGLPRPYAPPRIR